MLKIGLWLMFLGAASIGMTGNSWKQTETPGGHVVYYFVESGLKANPAEDYNSHIADALSPYGISIEFLPTADPYATPPHDALGVIRFMSGGYPQIMPIFTPFREISSILVDHTYDLTFRWPDDAAMALLYAIGRCDLVQSYLDEAGAIREQRLGYEGIDYFRGNCALAAGHYHDAADDYVTDLFSSGGNHYYLPQTVNLAWIDIQLGQQDTAFFLMGAALGDIEMFASNAYEGHPTESFFLTKRSQLYALVFRFNEAVTDMDSAIQLDPNNPTLYVERGQRWLLLYEWDKVLDDYNHAIELDPTYADAYYERGILYYTQGHRREALADFQRYLELAPDGEHAANAARYAADIPGQLEELATSTPIP